MRRSVRRLAVALLLAVWAGLAAVAVAGLAGRSLDDFFITYRYADNLAAGRGFAFNPGERVFGLTAPGHGLLLAAAGRLSGIAVDRLGTASTGAALVALAAVLWAAAVRRGRGPEAALGGTLLVLSTAIWSVHGAEGPVALALLAGTALAAGRWPVATGTVAGFAVWVRPESALAAGLLAALLAGEQWRSRRTASDAVRGEPGSVAQTSAGATLPRTGSPRGAGSGVPRGVATLRSPPLRFALAAAAVVAVGVGLAWHWFGTPVPVPLTAKRWIAGVIAAPTGGGFWPGAAPYLMRHLGTLWPLTLGLAAAGLVSLWRSGGRPARLLAVYALALGAAYPLLGVPFALWYAVPQLAVIPYGLTFLAGAAARAAGRLVSRSDSRRAPEGAAANAGRAGGANAGEEGGNVGLRPRGRRIAAAALAAAVAILLLAPPLRSAAPKAARWWAARHAAPHFEGYRLAGLWAREHTRPDDAIACVEVGTLAYFSDRPVEDLLGLVTPRSIPFVAEGDLLGAFLAQPTELVVDRPRIHGLMGQVVSPRWFPRAYEEAARFLAGKPNEVVVYRRRPGAEVPPPRPPQRPVHLRPGYRPPAPGAAVNPPTAAGP